MVKFDISKAYDKLNWQFIRKMLAAFGFSGNWINWVINLVSLTFFSIFIFSKDQTKAKIHWAERLIVQPSVGV